MKIIVFLIYFLFFTLLHELGHLCSAKIFRLKLQKIGLQIFPFPSFYMEVYPRNSFYIKFFHYLSGTIFIFITFLFILISKLYHNRILLSAILLRLFLDLNPFHSDISLLIGEEKYRYSIFWYVHFLLWLIFLFLILKNCKFSYYINI